MSKSRVLGLVSLFLCVAGCPRASEPKDTSIHIIPVLSAPSIKNGQTVKLSAVVKAAAGVRSVTADFGGIETIALKPETLGAIDTLRSIGVWSAMWTGHGLEEKIYPLTITVMDHAGRTFQDCSLEFSDPAAGISTPGVNTYPNGDVALARSDAAFLPSENSVYAVAYNPVTNMALFGANSTTPATVVQVDMGSITKAPARVGAVTLNAGENALSTAVFDSVNNVALFSTDTTPSQIIKVAFGIGGAAPTRVGAVTLNAGENRVYAAVIDPASNQALFGTFTSPGIVVKIAVNAAGATPTRVGAVTLNTGEDALTSAALDTASGTALFGTFLTSPGIVVKVLMNGIASPPTRDAALTLNAGESVLVGAIQDTNTGVALFGTNTSPGMVVKVAYGTPGNSPVRVGAVTLNTGENGLYCSALDSANGVAMFGTLSGTCSAVKIDINAANAAPTRGGAVAFPGGQTTFVASYFDAANRRFVLAPSVASNTQLHSVLYSPQGMLTGTAFSLAETAVLTDVRLYSHVSGGAVRLGIYDSNFKLLWETKNAAASVAAGEIVVPVANGTPSSLVLAPGNYFLAFQCGTPASVPSFTAGPPGAGFVFYQDFGAFTTTLPPASVVSTASRYTEYLTYSVYQGGPAITGLTTEDNPGFVGADVTYTLTVTGGDLNLPLTYSIAFGDGTPAATGSIQSGLPVSVPHVYNASGEFTVTATVTDGATPVTLTAPQSIPAPASGADGVKNVSDSKAPIENPIDGLKISVLRSSGGIIQLIIDVSQLRETHQITTVWGDALGRVATSFGPRPVHQFTQHGIFVANVTATDTASGAVIGRGRKTLTLSKKETGEDTSETSGDAPTAALTTKSIKGKFDFHAQKIDAVSFSGTFKLPPGLDTSKPHELAIAMGNIVATTTLDAKGAAPATGALKKLKVKFLKVRTGAVTVGGEDAQIAAQFSANGLVDAGFDTEGVTSKAADAANGKKAARSIQIALLLAGVPYETLAPVNLSLSKTGDSGAILGRTAAR